MRSVALSPASQQQRTVLFEPALQRVNPGGLAHLRPLRSVGQPIIDKAALKPQPLLRGPRRTKSESSLPWEWHVDRASLSDRPDDFPLLRTSRVIKLEPHVISKRISDCLQSRSIKTKISKGEGNVAKCRNTDFCKFTISLYVAGEDACDGGVLVEVHRLCGDCISFMKDCRALLNAAEGKKELHPGEDKPPFFRLPVSEMNFLKTASLPPLSQEEEVDCVNVTAELLSSRQSDTNMLGMESLEVQTDPLRSLRSTAFMASRRILNPDEQGNEGFNMHNYVMSLVIYGDDEALSAPEDSPLTAMEDHSTKLRNLAMSSLFNALSLLASENALLGAIHQEWYAEVLIPKLLRDLSTAARHPHDACYASRCLSVLARTSSDFAMAMKKAGGHEAVSSAEEVGAREFALLARYAGSYHKVLSCCV